MALRRVDLSTDVYFVCLNHAMCTEGEEIVGLLVGEVDEERVAHVVAVLILRRSDKRKDRVEISPEQLSNASTEAEKLACILKRPVRVVGWYHSHPKLTVYPSLVDVCTQESYQLMDEGFIGMIFSVFNSDPNKFGGRIQMICYQSRTVIIDCNVEKSHIEIPIQLVPSSNISDVCMNSVIQLPRFLCQEEQLAYQMANQVPLDYLTRLHNSSVYLRKMGQIAEVICGPLLKMLEERILNNEMKRKRLQEKKKALTALVEKARTDKVKIEEEKLERAKIEQEKIKEKQNKSELKEMEDLEEQEMRAALLKDQELRIKARRMQQKQDSSFKENNEGKTKHNEEKVQAKAQQSDKKELLLGDQEVPQLREQDPQVVEDQEMQELDSQKWKVGLDEPDWQAQLQSQEIGMFEKKDHEKKDSNVNHPERDCKKSQTSQMEKIQNKNQSESHDLIINTNPEAKQVKVKSKQALKSQSEEILIAGQKRVHILSTISDTSMPSTSSHEMSISPPPKNVSSSILEDINIINSTQGLNNQSKQHQS